MTRTRRWLALFAAALLTIGAIVGAPYLWRGIQLIRHARAAAMREPAALAAWTDAFGDPDALVARSTRPAGNATAERLTALAKPLGIQLVLGTPAAGGLAEANDIGKYVNTSGDFTPPPTDVPAYLHAHAAAIAAIVDLLTTADAPVWKSVVSSPLRVPRLDVSIVGIHVLNNVLAAEALLDASQGRPHDADRAMQAAWQVARSARDQPLFVGQMMSIQLAVTDLAVLRRTGIDANAWRGRLSGYDYAGAMETSVEMEVVEHIRANAGSWSGRAFLADYVDGMRTNLTRLQTARLTDSPASLPSFTSPEREPAIPPGIAVAAIGRPGIEQAWRTAQCTNLDVELTNQAIEARQQKTTTGRWRETMPAAASAVVSDARWIYTRTADGSVSISLDRATPSCAASVSSFSTRE